ncbi:hypothetical protein Hte_002553 [Hypoxylon texense]
MPSVDGKFAAIASGIALTPAASYGGKVASSRERGSEERESKQRGSKHQRSIVSGASKVGPQEHGVET